MNGRDEEDESIAIAGPLSGQQRKLEAMRNLGHEMEVGTTEEQAQEQEPSYGCDTSLSP